MTVPKNFMLCQPYKNYNPIIGLKQKFLPFFWWENGTWLSTFTLVYLKVCLVSVPYFSTGMYNVGEYIAKYTRIGASGPVLVSCYVSKPMGLGYSFPVWVKLNWVFCQVKALSLRVCVVLIPKHFPFWVVYSYSSVNWMYFKCIITPNILSAFTYELFSFRGCTETYRMPTVEYKMNEGIPYELKFPFRNNNKWQRNAAKGEAAQLRQIPSQLQSPVSSRVSSVKGDGKMQTPERSANIPRSISSDGRPLENKR